MSIIHFLSCRDYWNDVLGNQHTTEAITVNMFENIKKKLHFNDDAKMTEHGKDGHDHLYRIQPVYESLHFRFFTFPMEECLSVDAKMCPTKARHILEQYMPNKPHKWGYKL
jgi:hypothetical protein